MIHPSAPQFAPFTRSKALAAGLSQRAVSRALARLFLVCLAVAALVPRGTWAATAPFETPLDQVTDLQAVHVVRFDVQSWDDGNSAWVKLQTRGGFELYDKGFGFFADSGAFGEISLKFEGSPNKSSRMDPFYKEPRSVWASGTVFRVNLAGLHPSEIRVQFESCSQKICLLPVSYALSAVAGAPGRFLRVERKAMENTSGGQAPLRTSASPQVEPTRAEPTQPPSQVEPTRAEPTRAEPSLAQKVGIWAQRLLLQRSLLLYPLLFLAGLLMNLTPCVYPMIPITLNVLTHFGNSDEGHKRGKFASAAIYVLGMAITYSLVGVVSALTGNVFGSLLQSTAFAVGIALLLFVLGLGMLGFFSMTAVQSWAAHVRLSERHPVLGLLGMGALSGLVSAPCTGPVLSSILLLIAETHDALLGFLLMFFLSLGFGLPYLLMGAAAHKIKKLPKIPKALHFVKLAFASLMFALSMYYLRPFLIKTPLIFLYVEPSLTSVALALLIVFMFEFVKAEHHLAKFFRFSSIVVTSLLALWLTLAITHSFALPPSADTPASQNGEIPWRTKWEQATAEAQRTGRPLLVDIWAEWCTACKELDKDVWGLPSVQGAIRNSGYIPVKLDATDNPPDIAALLERWKVPGLPAVGLYTPGVDPEKEPPTQLVFGTVDPNKMIQYLQDIAKKNSGH